MACTRIVDMQGANPSGLVKSGFQPNFCQPLSENIVGLENIICNSGIKVPLQLLAVEETIEPLHDHKCKYENLIKKICILNGTQFAHIYVADYNPNAFIKHYIIAFIEGKKSEKFDELIDILHHTAQWLKIDDKKPYFYIYYYGNRPALNMSINELRDRIKKELRQRIKNYKENEPFCRTKDMDRKAKNFIIHQNNKATTYEFNFS